MKLLASLAISRAELRLGDDLQEDLGAKVTAKLLWRLRHFKLVSV